jgi:hypothetical protein
MGTDQLLDLFHVSDLAPSKPKAGAAAGLGSDAMEQLGAMCDDTNYEDYNVEGFLKSMG